MGLLVFAWIYCLVETAHSGQILFQYLYLAFNYSGIFQISSPWSLEVHLSYNIWRPIAPDIILAMVRPSLFGRTSGSIVVLYSLLSLAFFVWLAIRILGWLVFGCRMLLLGICTFATISNGWSYHSIYSLSIFVPLLILGFGRSTPHLPPLSSLLSMIWWELIITMLWMFIRLFGWIVFQRKLKIFCGSLV